MTWMATRMSTIKLNTDCTCLGHLTKNSRSVQEGDVRSLQENSQSERAYKYGHTRNTILRQIRHHLEILRNEKHVQWINKDDNNILNSIMKVP